MPLGTLDRTPPPFFRQGPSALTKLLFCAAMSLFLMAADSRFAFVKPMRAALASVLYYPQRALLWPVQQWQDAETYLSGLQLALTNEAKARKTLAMQAERAARVDDLEQENARLRSLLDLRDRIDARSQAAEVLYQASDPYSRKVIVDRGAAHNVMLGSPVINEDGVLGQVTRVYPLSSEVTLLTDKDAAIPLLNTRNQQRSVAYGLPGGNGLELRFMAGTADVQIGDTLDTSGVDAVYPPGVPVAKISAIDRRSDAGFARVLLTPTATPDGVRHVLVLEPLGVQLPPRPEPVVAAPPAKGAKKDKDKGSKP